MPQPAVFQMFYPILSGTHSRIVMQHAIDALTESKIKKCQDIFGPHVLSESDTSRKAIQPEHFACPMVNPITGETISSYKNLMNDPAMSETWQTAFGKDFGGISHGDNNTGQKGTNAMFVMTYDKIHHVLATGQKFTYSNPVIDYQPQKEDTNPDLHHSWWQFNHLCIKPLSPFCRLRHGTIALEQCY
jgi:hypothetical protein